eukprot:m51a1_g9140 hypothetical protein (308) ;mRNA; r:75289-76437
MSLRSGGASLQNSEAYGRLRLFGGIGYCVAGLAVGVVLEAGDSSLDSVAWGAFAVLVVAAGGLASLVSYDRRGGRLRSGPDAVRLLDSVLALVRRRGVLRFLFVVFAMGLCTSLAATFVPLALENAFGAASGRLVGAGVALSIATEGPCFYWSREITRRLGGPRGVIALAHAAMALRMLGHALAPSAALEVAPSLLHGATFALMWAATVSHAASVAPVEMSATMQAVVAACYYGLGGGAAALVGGAVYQAAGHVRLFAGAAVLVCVSLCVFWTADTRQQRSDDPGLCSPAHSRSAVRGDIESLVGDD